MKLLGEWIGMTSLQKTLAEYSEQKQKDVALAVAEGVLAIHAEARKSIQRIASKGNERPDGSYASKPGFPPNTDTGRLVQSIDFDIDMENAEGRIYSNLEYAPHMEFGTENIAPRPFMAPAYAKHRESIIKNIKKALKGP
jgi:hypothetical protein